MARDEDAGHFEWVNAWASAPAAMAETVVATPPAEPKPAVTTAVKPLPAPVPPADALRFTTAKPATPAPVAAAEPVTLAPRAPAEPEWPADQLMRDIAEIERVRDALDGGALTQRMRAFTLVPSRAAEATPIVIGGALALALLTVFGAAAVLGR